MTLSRTKPPTTSLGEEVQLCPSKSSGPQSTCTPPVIKQEQQLQHHTHNEAPERPCLLHILFVDPPPDLGLMFQFHGHRYRSLRIAQLGPLLEDAPVPLRRGDLVVHINHIPTTRWDTTEQVMQFVQRGGGGCFRRKVLEFTVVDLDQRADRALRSTTIVWPTRRVPGWLLPPPQISLVPSTQTKHESMSINKMSNNSEKSNTPSGTEECCASSTCVGWKLSSVPRIVRLWTKLHRHTHCVNISHLQHGLRTASGSDARAQNRSRSEPAQQRRLVSLQSSSTTLVTRIEPADIPRSVGDRLGLCCESLGYSCYDCIMDV